MIELREGRIVRDEPPARTPQRVHAREFGALLRDDGLRR